MKTIYKILFAIVLLFPQLRSYSQVAIEDQSVFLDSVLVNLQKSSDPIGSLDILDQQLNIKNLIIDKIKFQIVQIDKDIKNNEIYYDKLNSDLNYEKKIYADLIVRASRLNSLVHQKFDIFSLDNLYTTYRRFLYIKWMADYRKKKIYRINNLKAEIAQVVQELDNNKLAKSKFAEKIGVEQSFISQYKASKSQIIKDLAHTSANSQSQIRRDNLDSIKNDNVVAVENNSDTSTLFQVQKGYLIWPVKRSAIVNYYGEKPHPVYDNVMVKNDGLDFCVPNDAKVMSVFHGTVTKISSIQNGKYIVIIRHGGYFTVFNGLDDVDVDEGDEVEKGEEIGSFDSDDDHCILNFQIWKGSETLDPYKWLIKLPTK